MRRAGWILYALNSALSLRWSYGLGGLDVMMLVVSVHAMIISMAMIYDLR